MQEGLKLIFFIIIDNLCNYKKNSVLNRRVCPAGGRPFPSRANFTTLLLLTPEVFDHFWLF